MNKYATLQKWDRKGLRCMKRCLVSVVTQELQIKTTRRCHLPIRLEKIMHCVDKDVGKHVRYSHMVFVGKKNERDFHGNFISVICWN